MVERVQRHRRVAAELQQGLRRAQEFSWPLEIGHGRARVAQGAVQFKAQVRGLLRVTQRRVNGRIHHVGDPGQIHRRGQLHREGTHPCPAGGRAVHCGQPRAQRRQPGLGLSQEAEHGHKAVSGERRGVAGTPQALQHRRAAGDHGQGQQAGRGRQPIGARRDRERHPEIGVRRWKSDVGGEPRTQAGRLQAEGGRVWIEHGHGASTGGLTGDVRPIGSVTTTLYTVPGAGPGESTSV